MLINPARLVSMVREQPQNISIRRQVFSLTHKRQLFCQSFDGEPEFITLSLVTMTTRVVRWTTGPSDQICDFVCGSSFDSICGPYMSLAYPRPDY